MMQGLIKGNITAPKTATGGREGILHISRRLLSATFQNLQLKARCITLNEVVQIYIQVVIQFGFYDLGSRNRICVSCWI